MPREHAAKPAAKASGWTLLAFVSASLFVANILQWFLCRIFRLGNPGSLKSFVHDFWHLHQWTDSWLPMMQSLDYFRAHPDQPIYSAHLYDTLIYSLASELPLVLLRKLGVSDPAMLRIFAITTWLCIPGIAIVCLLMGKRLLAARGVRLDWPTIIAVFLACIGSYPLLKGYGLGNAQTYLSLLFAVLLLLWTTGRERSAGVIAALLTLVKPQYGLLLVWMALRRRWGAATAFLATTAILLGIAALVFGWRNNLDYLHVLAGLSHKAQSHFANQSMFGTINRAIFNGENISYTPNVYTPYIPWVYRVTVLTSLVIVGTVLFFPWRKLAGSTADLAAMGLASVAASPMAWEHHYGIATAIFFWAWFAYACYQRRPPWLLGLSFFLCTNFLAATNYLSARPGWNILQSYMYIGALLLLFLLLRLAHAADRSDRSAFL